MKQKSPQEEDEEQQREKDLEILHEDLKIWVELCVVGMVDDWELKKERLPQSLYFGPITRNNGHIIKSLYLKRKNSMKTTKLEIQHKDRKHLPRKQWRKETYK